MSPHNPSHKIALCDYIITKPYSRCFGAYAKRRWLKQNILDLMTREFVMFDSSYYENAISKGKVLVNGNKVDSHYEIADGDYLEHFVDFIENTIDPTGFIDIIFENDNFLIVDKPYSLPLHPCGKWNEHSLTAILTKYLKLKRERIESNIDENNVSNVKECSVDFDRIESNIDENNVRNVKECSVDFDRIESNTDAPGNRVCNVEESSKETAVSSNETTPSSPLPKRLKTSQHYKSSEKEEPIIFPLHRIDKQTSGIVILGKNRKSARLGHKIFLDKQDISKGENCKKSKEKSSGNAPHQIGEIKPNSLNNKLSCQDICRKFYITRVSKLFNIDNICHNISSSTREGLSVNTGFSIDFINNLFNLKEDNNSIDSIAIYSISVTGYCYVENPSTGTSNFAFNIQDIDEKYRGKAKWSETILYFTKNSKNLLVEPLTGRTHQIRLVCSIGLNNPIVNDLCYFYNDGYNVHGPGTIAKDISENQSQNSLEPTESLANDTKLPPLDTSAIRRRYMGICLHSVRYILPSIGIDVTSELPGWVNA